LNTTAPSANWYWAGCWTPRALVFDTWSRPEHVGKWWGAGAKTSLTMRMAVDSAQRLAEMKKYGAVEGGKQTLDRLEASVWPLWPTNWSSSRTRGPHFLAQPEAQIRPTSFEKIGPRVREESLPHKGNDGDYADNAG
jgi:hypothetical protein